MPWLLIALAVVARLLPHPFNLTPVGALGFFLLSNLGNWYAFYPHTLSALVECYVRGLPLLGNTLVGDALFGAILFGADALWRASRPSVTAAH